MWKSQRILKFYIIEALEGPTKPKSNKILSTILLHDDQEQFYYYLVINTRFFHHVLPRTVYCISFHDFMLGGKILPLITSATDLSCFVWVCID
jgi:hypothetical protein